ncbi:MAG: Na+-transporting oxaloacetate decarboxylase beta subunit [Herbinix sp.]|jgi:Na+-transporting methylmalonyl-CoA/oxaloacetate decarboxylase beta subunit|nr:Na+-transporting oxaloacetate decarboxylase beta subunit [Herbinix sp.]
MIRKLISIGIAVITILSGLMIMFHVTVYYLLPKLLVYHNHVVEPGAASIGIIGSADGPTSILVTSITTQFLIPICLILFVAGIVYFIVLKLRKK